MNKINKNSKQKILASVLAFGIIAGTVAPILMSVDTLAVSWCTSAKCKEAEAKEQEAAEKANSAAQAADTLDGEINRLNQEIAMYEARILANKEKATDLKAQIEENTKKLELQKEALAEMIINVYLEGDTDELMVLASSNSLSDYAETQ
ncbi:hypothetical protein IJ798_00965, partial [Candidatus Saccharibacteria bacterium]|nr:hypothetical protein [Candidatus Saccharibacteria bacterium]